MKYRLATKAELKEKPYVQVKVGMVVGPNNTVPDEMFEELKDAVFELEHGNYDIRDRIDYVSKNLRWNIHFWMLTPIDEKCTMELFHQKMRRIEKGKLNYFCQNCGKSL